MIIHIDPKSGSPIFILGQMNMISSLRAVYEKYGIHGIYYAVLFGWPGSPYASVTDEEQRDAYVVKEVYGNTYYDSIRKEQITIEDFSVKEQYKAHDMAEAMKVIYDLARVPVIENRLLYLRLLDRNKLALDVEFHPDNHKGNNEMAGGQKVLLSNRTILEKNLNETMEREKEILMKSDPKMSLDDFINKIGKK